MGLFDESFGYGYDNDLSYRLIAAGYRLTFCRAARSVHTWREGLGGYVVQQYGFGYGRIDLVSKHPARFHGDTVSRTGMMSHPVLMSLAIVGLAIAAAMAITTGPWRAVAAAAALLLAGLTIERCAAGIAAARRFRTMTPLVFPVLHLIRDLAWVTAIVVWLLRRVSGRPSKPSVPALDPAAYASAPNRPAT